MTISRVTAYSLVESWADSQPRRAVGWAIRGATVTWLDDETGEVVQQTARLAEWEEIRPAGRLFFVTNADGVTIHDPHSSREWEMPGATYQGTLGWGSEGDYFTVSFGEHGDEGQFWLFNLKTGDLVWDGVAEDQMAS